MAIRPLLPVVVSLFACACSILTVHAHSSTNTPGTGQAAGNGGGTVPLSTTSAPAAAASAGSVAPGAVDPSVSAAVASGSLVQISYANPLINSDFPDPSVLLAGDGWYYAYATQGSGGNIQVARSQDLSHWQRVGDALPYKPAWANQTQSFWAPDVKLHDGTYYMYFSSAHNGQDGMCVGVATASQPAGPFTATDSPLICGASFINIDPMGFDDPATGRHWLYWGSGFQPIKIQELSADRLSFLAGSAPTNVIEQSAFGLGLLEGPWVTYRDGYYYLFASGDDCCGSPANNNTPHYLVVVARSTSPVGPFTPAAQPILQAGGRWLGPGHNAVIRDAAGTDWMLYHAVDSGNRLENGHIRRPLMLDRMGYANGWPAIQAGIPSDSTQPGPAVAAF